jgi:prepilin-type N-terminal cleavage/methylation domain-containing protein
MVTNRRYARAFTLIELLVVIAVIAVLVAILLPSLSRAREAGRRATCMGHLHRIQTAWHMYATDHDDFIVNGEAELDYQVHNPGKPWCINGYSYSFVPDPDQSLAAMRTGGLAAYVGDVRTYLCPSRYRHNDGPWQHWGTSLSSYHTVASMNRWPPDQWLKIDREVRANRDVGGTVLFVRKTSELAYPGASSRMVFMDLGTYGGETASGQKLDHFAAKDMEGLAWSGEFAWPAVHHVDGMCASFGDGHVEYWRWTEPATVTYGRFTVRWLIFGEEPQHDWPTLDSILGNPDSVRMSRAVWGKWPLGPRIDGGQ